MISVPAERRRRLRVALSDAALALGCALTAWDGDLDELAIEHVRAALELIAQAQALAAQLEAEP